MIIFPNYLTSSNTVTYFKLPESDHELVELGERLKKEDLNLHNINKKMKYLFDKVMEDPEIYRSYKSLSAIIDNYFENLGFSGVSATLRLEPNLDTLDLAEFGFFYSNRPTILLLDQLHSFSLRILVKKDFFKAIKKTLLSNTQKIDKRIAGTSPEVSNLINNIFKDIAKSKNFNEMIMKVSNHLKYAAPLIDKFIDHLCFNILKIEDEKLNTLISNLLKLTCQIKIEDNQLGNKKQHDELFGFFKINLFVVNTKLSFSLQEDLFMSEININVRDLMYGKLMKLKEKINKRQDFVDMMTYILIVIKYVESMNAEQEDLFIYDLKVMLLEWAENYSDA